MQLVDQAVREHRSNQCAAAADVEVAVELVGSHDAHVFAEDAQVLPTILVTASP